MKDGKRLFKKVAGVRKERVLGSYRNKLKYEAIQYLNREKKYSIISLCEVAAVSRASYYKWLKRDETENNKINDKLIKEIIQLYEEFSGIYGYRRMTMNINRKLNRKYNHKRIYRLMRMLGLKSVIRIKKKKYIKVSAEEIAYNKLNRDFKASNINEKWLTDVTEFKYGVGKKAYLSAILDLYDNSIISYEIGHSNNNSLVFKTFDKAIKANPNARPLFHSDYTEEKTIPKFYLKYCCC